MMKVSDPMARRWTFGAVLAVSGIVAAPRFTRAATPQIGHVFYIEMDNHNLTQPASDTTAPKQLLGNPAAPFLNSLMTPAIPTRQ